jgi:hypothetical protein
MVVEEKQAGDLELTEITALMFSVFNLDLGADVLCIAALGNQNHEFT